MTVFFETNSAELTNPELDSIRRFIITFPNITNIEGFADSTGTTTYNFGLSKRRALAVYEIVKARIKKLNSTIVGYGGETEQFPGLALNRRVEICAQRAIPQPSEKDRTHKVENDTMPDIVSRHGSVDTIRVITLENLYFLPDRPIVTEESIPSLQELAQQLKAYPSAIFEIVGHINYQSRYDSTHLGDLYQLSTKRAKVVYEYLLEYGIASSRIRYKGVGNSQPAIASPKNDGERMKNMRVQIIVLRK